MEGPLGLTRAVQVTQERYLCRVVHELGVDVQHEAGAGAVSADSEAKSGAPRSNATARSGWRLTKSPMRAMGRAIVVNGAGSGGGHAGSAR